MSLTPRYCVRNPRYREYNLPNALIRIYPDRTCRQFPKWCLNINVTHPRPQVAAALWQYRAYRRLIRHGATHDAAVRQLRLSHDAAGQPGGA